MNPNTFRKTTQYLAPARHEATLAGVYDIYPGFPVGPGRISSGFPALASAILSSGSRAITIDGFGGVLWEHFASRLSDDFRRLGVAATLISIDTALKPASEIDRLIAPSLGGNDPLYGTRSEKKLKDFFVPEKLRAATPDPGAQISVVYGCGAALAGWKGLRVYVDVPKNEVQFRSRAGSIRNIGASQPMDPKPMYKRFYFIDWPVLNRHRAQILRTIDLFVDEQRPDEPVLMSGGDFRKALDSMARNAFRVRPWFEPGPWGGQWIKSHIPQLSPDAKNYAWSFELISPENGIAFESDGLLLEASFDFLMFQNHHQVLGAFGARFGYEFPIRYDFLDTFDGGNLSVQCHPRPRYIHDNFGECFTQDEAYYILDCKPGARVYLGFQEGLRPKEFRAELERSLGKGVSAHVDRFVNTVRARKHDFFLIPNGTIHCSGINNLVLEISATPYIFTFKMYDWMRMDLDGKPRTLNIDRAFDNLYFERQGKRVEAELVSRPHVLCQGPDWQLFHLPTHPRQFYDVHRYEFMRSVQGHTRGSCQVMNLVDGDSIIVETDGGIRQLINYAETFIIPEAAGTFRLVNNTCTPAKVVSTFLKPDARPYAPPPGASR